MATLVAHASTEIDASPSKVWQSLLSPEGVKYYMMGADLDTDWVVGSPISWKGEWDGHPYEDSGTVLAVDPEKRLEFDHFSPMGGTEDIPENHRKVTIELSPSGNGKTSVELSQDNVTDEDELKDSEKNWRMMVGKLKEFAEK